MATYRVTPLPDGVDQRSNWQVKKNGETVSRHTKKSAAKRVMDSKASPGDLKVVHGTNGEVLRSNRDRRGGGGGGSGSGSSGNGVSIPGAGGNLDSLPSF